MSLPELNNLQLEYSSQDQVQLEQEVNTSKMKENPAACVFVASLNKDLEDTELQSYVYNHFEQWGHLLGVKVLKDWLKRPYAFVQYQNVQDCKKALKEAPGTMLNGRCIRCEPARVNRSIFLISMNQPFNKKDIQKMLSVFGEVEDVTILQPHGKLHSVFIKYKYRDDAIQAYLSLKFPDQHPSYSKSRINNSQQWFVEWASNLDGNNLFGLCGNSCRLDRFTIFVGNLCEDISQNDLYEEFGCCGKIVNIHVIRKPNYRHRTRKVFAFIKYDNEREAAEAIDQMNGLNLKGKTIRVCYKQYYSNHNKNTRYNMNKVLPTMPMPTMVPTPPYYYLEYEPSSYQQQMKLAYMEEYPAPYICMPYNSSTTPTIYDPCMTGMIPQQPSLDSSDNNNNDNSNTGNSFNNMAPSFTYSYDASCNTRPVSHSSNNASSNNASSNNASSNNAGSNNAGSNNEESGGYYVDPMMVYYSYSPYTPYKINMNFVKNVGANKQGVTGSSSTTTGD